jgi:hypothetical protein
MAELESSYEAAILTDSGPGIVAELPSPGHSTPPRPAVAPTSSSPPAAPPRPAVAGRAVRRLDLAIDNAQASESTQPVDEADAAFPSCPESPDSCCSQRRLQAYESEIRFSAYPAPPDAPRKDQYIAESESEAESPPLRRPAKIFRNGILMYHKNFKGTVPITYVDTRLYEGGHDDYYEAYSQSDLRWIRRIHYLLDAHKIPR